MKKIHRALIGVFLAFAPCVAHGQMRPDSTAIRQAIRNAFAGDAKERLAREVADQAAFERDYRRCTGQPSHPVCSIVGDQPVYFVKYIHAISADTLIVRIVKFSPTSSGTGLAKSEQTWDIPPDNRWLDRYAINHCCGNILLILHLRATYHSARLKWACRRQMGLVPAWRYWKAVDRREADETLNAIEKR